MDRILDIATGFFSESGRLIGGIIESFADNDKPKGYSASFAKEKELLSERHKGFCMTGAKNLPLDITYQNAYIQSPTGGGKTTVVILPTIYTTEASLVIHDPSGELLAKSGSQIAARGYDVRTLNFAHADISSGYNPLAHANTQTQIRKLASLLVESSIGGTQKSDPFWNALAVDLITMLIELTKTLPREYQTMHTVLQLLNNIHAQ